MGFFIFPMSDIESIYLSSEDAIISASDSLMNFNQRDGNTDKECWPEFSVFKLFNIRFAALARALDKNISSNLFDPKTRSP